MTPKLLLFAQQAPSGDSLFIFNAVHMQKPEVPRIRSLVRLAVLITMSLTAAAPDSLAKQNTDADLASTDGLKVVCGAGLLPLAVHGILEGEIELPAGKVIFSGQAAYLAYCGYPAADGLPSLLKPVGRSVRGKSTSYAVGPNGLRLTCRHGALPFVLLGSAEGSLPTRTGVLNLQGDQNNVAVCIR